MKSIVLISFLATIALTAKTQVKALTETGKQVILNDDGTWKYLEDSTADQGTISTDSIRVNTHKFSKTASANFLVKSNVFNVGVYIDPSKCIFTTHKDNEVNPEYRFNLKNGNAYGILMTEKTQIELPYMPEIALVNAEKEASDARIVNKEYRMVNNKKVLMLQMRATIRSIKFVYLGYYYSNENGTAQFLTYTTQNNFEKSQSEMEALLNGLIER